MKNSKNMFLDNISSTVRERYPDKHSEIMASSWARFCALCAENPNEPKAVQTHTRNRIYPAIAVFEALVEAGSSREDASQLIHDYYTSISKKSAKVIQILLKIPGLYKAIPRIFLMAVQKMFGPDAGFRAKHYENAGNCFQMDMLECPYMNTCQKYGCPEIVPAFCASDDVAYGNMHPKLKWGRTKTLGRGYDCCDFKLTIE